MREEKKILYIFNIIIEDFTAHYVGLAHLMRLFCSFGEEKLYL